MFPRRKVLLSYTGLQNEECKEKHKRSFGFSEYLQGSRKIIPKEEQERAIKQLISGNDFLAILPTGFGKSMVYTICTLASQNM